MLTRKERLIILVLCITFPLVFSGGCDKNSHLFYASLAEAAKAGEADRGWIPDYLPKTSRAIHITEQLSPSREWCSFEFLPSDSHDLRGTLMNFALLPQSVKRVPSPRASWWPGMLEGNLDQQRIRKEGFELYIVETPADSVSTWVNLFAIDWSNGRGFFYGTRE